ncbi:ABC transporter substrate-binding protein [Olsenella sp. YH-ols2217]|uniref:ABC transporter substrate-binding protein n=1 Tax=Kribbibacterium absianum TaxID=3044210 RepID=A0ABT6ZMI9_9ACTN|nr:MULTISPECIES: ABC transporter substrate-binding protein [unclassified Olsenella]MDJ1122331.1 ABC transporter substrate-binding protein [Olsenella sp. YH-ols2216]MDJ1130255.1 ABC transporter substrate-binding protein [Olsenella sp. YH-ols2217]
MKKHHGLLALVVCALLGVCLTLGLTACGGSGSASDDSATKATSTDSTDSSSDGASTATDYTTVTDGKLTMISSFAFPPFEYMDGDDYAGFDVDVFKALCDKLGLEPNILPSVAFDTIVPTIKSGGKADVSLAAMTITDERLAEVDMSDPYMDSNQSICVKKGASATDVDSLNVKGTQIAVQSGTTGEAWAKENLPNATIVPLDDIIQAMTGVSTGLYAACVSDLPVVKYEIEQAYSDLEVTVEIPTGEQYGVAVSKDNPGLTSAINNALKEMEDDGTMDSIETTWFGSSL